MVVLLNLEITYTYPTKIWYSDVSSIIYANEVYRFQCAIILQSLTVGDDMLRTGRQVQEPSRSDVGPMTQNANITFEISRTGTKWYHFRVSCFGLSLEPEFITISFIRNSSIR